MEKKSRSPIQAPAASSDGYVGVAMHRRLTLAAAVAAGRKSAYEAKAYGRRRRERKRKRQAFRKANGRHVAFPDDLRRHKPDGRIASSDDAFGEA